ncbi:MAG: serine/threonine-protein kinase [Acidobacteria bacterium]|nr:serine/threonine-protein kinase [Acidobacteriota bacterium]
MSLQIGQRLAQHYRLERHVGTGGFGEVWEATDEHLARRVAIKLVRDSDPETLALLLRVAQLKHPHIIQTFEILQQPEGLLAVLEWGGSDLDDLTMPLAPGRLLDLARQLSDALGYAHQRGILHRDLKPTNVLAGEDGVFRLSDFGAAGMLNRQGQTQVGQLAGTPLYMAPEQATGQPQSAATDFFGLGLLIYRCIWGRVPGYDSGFGELLRARALEAIAVPPLPPGYEGFAPVLRACLAFNAADRPATAEAFQALLPKSGAVRAGEFTQQMGRPTDSPPSAPRFPDAVGAPPPPPPPLARNSITIQAAPAMPGRSGAGGRFTSTAVIIAVAVIALAAGFFLPRTLGSPGLPSTSTFPLARVMLGAVLSAAGIGGAILLRRRWSGQNPELQQQAAHILFGAASRDDLTRTLMVQVDRVVSGLRSVDAAVVGVSVVAMVREYETAKESSDRQKALMNVVELMAKIQNHLAPWHVRHKDALTTGIAVVGCLVGIAQAVAAFLKK